MAKEKLRLNEMPLHEEKTWETDGTTVLSASVTLPHAEGHDRRARRFNRYYRAFCRAYFAYCASELLPRAEEKYRGALSRSAPFFPPRAELAYTVSYESDTALSLYADAREIGLAPPLTLRRADTWDLQTAVPLSLADLFPKHSHYKKKLLARIRAEAAQRVRDGASYDEDYRLKLRRAFNSTDFYLCKNGLRLFYPMYTFAPASEGIPSFLIAFGGEEGLRQP